ncbi:MAG: alpha/beta hydrolase [Tepidiformaceae bacterium]
MTFQARRHMRSRVGLGVLYAVFGLAAIAALGGGVETFKESRDHRALAMPGELISVGDHGLHIFCTGTGHPTVVLEPGLGEPSSVMSGWIAPEVSLHTRVCVYDRAGRGWSESTASPQDGLAVAADLHTLLKESGERGPYVLAGHSLGGIYVMNFANLYPDEVAGVVLLDSMHPQQYERISSYPTFYQAFRRVSALLPSVSRFGLARLVASSGSTGLPPQARNEERAFWSTARQFRSLRDEFAQLPTALDQAGALKTLGDKPLIVVTAGKGAQEGWPILQDELARLSSNVLHRLVPDASHAELVENETDAAVSSQAVVDVVSSVRAGQALSIGRH